MINIDEIRDMQKAGVDAKNAKDAAEREERRKRTEAKIPYFEEEIKKAAERGDGYWRVPEGWNDYDWSFLKCYFESLGFYAAMTTDDCGYIWLRIVWDEKDAKRIRDEIILYEKMDSWDYTKGRLYNKLKRFYSNQKKAAGG